MATYSKRKPLFMMLVLTILLVSSAYADLVPIAHAAEPPVQDKAIDVLNDVVGIDTEEYATTPSSQLDNQYLGLPQKEADIYLVSEYGSVRASFSFVNNMLRQVYLSDYEGEFAVKQPAVATVDMAKGFLQRCQNYAGDSFYGELASTLDNVNVSTNITKFAGNIKLEVNNFDNIILDYVWTYTDENGIVAKTKNVILSYDQGQLKVFLNNWPFYKVAGTPKVSAEEATAIAVEAAKNFSYQVSTDNGTATVTGFNIAPESLGYATLSYVNFPEQSLARGGDPFTLYPSWYVPLGFDKFYPGDVTGMTVSIWADTGEVSIIGPMVADIANESSGAEETTIRGFNHDSAKLAAPIMLIVIFSTIGVSLVSRKKVFKLVGNRKMFLKFWVTLIGGILLFSALLLVIPTVDASSTIPNSRSRVYACLDTPDGYDEPAYTPEREASIWVCGQVADAFVSSGYVTYNLCGEGTLYSDVYSQATADCQCCDRATVFHVGHRALGGYQDNWGTPILSDEIRARTTGTHKFVFLWVCDKVKDPTFGMPLAWTQRDQYHPDGYMNANGYLDPDCKGQCVIGFKGFSPIISGYQQTFKSQMTGPCKDFIKSFYDYALKIVPGSNYAVRDSLNKASLDFFGTTYTSSPLYGEDGTGYMAWYPISGQYESGYMRVFGDGSIWIFQPTITFTTNYGLSPTFYLDGEPHSVGDIHVWPTKLYTISVSDVPNYSFDHFSYYGTDLGHQCSTQLPYSGAFTAYYNWDPTYYTLSISSGAGGYTSPSGNQEYLSYTYAEVEAIPDNDSMVFDGWLLDDVDMGCNPTIEVLMDEPHTLEAAFTTAPDYKWVSSIYDYGGLVDYPEKLVGWRNDSEFTYLTGLGPTEYYGWINATMNTEAAAHIYVYGYADYGEGCVYVYVSSDGEEWDFVSAPEVNQSSPYWIDCGLCNNPFNYILRTTENSETVYTLALDSVRVEPFAYYNLTVSSGAGGYTVPATGVYEYPETSQVPVTAYANGGYDFDYWLLDGDPYSQNPITVTMNDDHELQAVFCEEPVYHWLTVEAYDEYECELNPSVWVDGDWVDYAPVMVSVTEGWHLVEVEDPWLYWELVWLSDDYGNGESRPVYSDTTITAYYEFYY